MRSDREEIPAPFTKEDADKAETMEARQRMSRAAAGCQTYWPSPYEVCGVIRDKYNSLGGPASFLSFPNSPEYTNPGNTGKRTQFLNGPIYWSAATGAHPVVNSFLNRWGLNGYEAGRLKYPTTDEIVLPDGGRRQEFQQGAIYVAFQNAVGSAILNGPIRDKYNSIGGLAPGGTLLGYLIQDQLAPLPDGQGQMARFQNGVIYWHPSTGAFVVRAGVILDVWSQSGYEGGVYGYPIADQVGGPLNVRQDFQNGDIEYSLQNPVAQDFYDCKLNTEWPHVSSHEDNRVNVVTTGTCTDPKRKIEHDTRLWYYPECDSSVLGCGGVQYFADAHGEQGDGVNAVVQDEVWSSANMECRPGEYRAETEWTIINADGGELNEDARTNRVRLGFGTGGLDKNCDRTYN